jgi:hypothetical protein
MSYEEFQNLARLFAVGLLETEDWDDFLSGCLAFGERAEAFILKCRSLNAALALSLEPIPPAPATKGKLMAKIRQQECGRRLPEGGTAEETTAQNLMKASSDAEATAPVMGLN